MSWWLRTCPVVYVPVGDVCAQVCKMRGAPEIVEHLASAHHGVVWCYVVLILVFYTRVWVFYTRVWVKNAILGHFLYTTPRLMAKTCRLTVMVALSARVNYPMRGLNPDITLALGV